ncbi:hypothetical protein CcrColossus_gp425 [Caulobacter phage CcrColossus]|uniref:Uncharacterized protein n=1 Tax=Caulobacter phage CcrColossus TaxID=1211640 RepID=K4JVA0_9CAUD|nr:hypothetical protein CcrColossus_gp425 [Caulobacter phage CcrColossus]AFU88295.1 hypothetical protein CcrColossus_gp425 [Caulobacter phage CcrColossus]
MNRVSSPPPPAGPYLHLLDRVDLEQGDFPVPGSLSVQPIWKGVDRPKGTSYAFRPEHHQYAYRLRDLMLSGRAFTGAVVKTDINGKTFMSAGQRFAVMTIETCLDTLEKEA